MCVWLVSVHVYAQGDTKAGHWVSSSIAVSLIYLGHSTRSSPFLVCCVATELAPHMSTAPSLVFPPLAGVRGAGLCSRPMLVPEVPGSVLQPHAGVNGVGDSSCLPNNVLTHSVISPVPKLNFYWFPEATQIIY